ncbi:MAG: hypothetical protein AAGO57_05725 [Pseudomonadota bacterium]
MSRSLDLPELSPPARINRRRRSRVISRSLELSPSIELTHDSVHDEAVVPSKREEPRNETARLTVYAFNAILMVMAFPVGMALLLFNILGGENLRTTAHAIALTGTAIALSMTPLGRSILSLI